MTILTLGCPTDEDGNIILDKTQVTGSISYQDIQVDYGDEASRTVDLAGITPTDAANSDYLYSVEPPFSNGVTLNLTNGTITVGNNVSVFSNTYTITAIVDGNDPQYKGSVTGSISINVEDSRTQVTGSISYQDIQVDYGDEASRTVDLAGITPPDAANSDYSYSVEPPLPNGVTLNPSDGTITVANNAPGSSNTYTITATIDGNDLQYKGSVTGSISIISIKVNHFSERDQHSVVEFNNELYLIGGGGNSFSCLNDVWKSSDGATWIEVINPAPFSARRGHSVVEFNNELYLIGGYDAGIIRYNDVWKSSDGTTWTQVTNQAQFSGRYEHSVVEFNNELYLIGGSDSGNSYKNDVWKSSDGATWTKVTDPAPFSARKGHSVVVFNNELYLIGGYDNSYYNDVWKSSDGATWTKVTDPAPFSGRYAHSVVEFNNELYLIGGKDGNSIFNDVWKSSDGIDWTEVTTTQSKFSARNSHSVVEFNNELYLIGGYGGSRLNDVWKSSDGIDWEKKL